MSQFHPESPQPSEQRNWHKFEWVTNDQREPNELIIPQGRLAFATGVGYGHDPNEDTVGIYTKDPDRIILIIGDGVGGSLGARDASRIVVEEVLDAAKKAPQTPDQPSYQQQQECFQRGHDRAQKRMSREKVLGAACYTALLLNAETAFGAGDVSCFVVKPEDEDTYAENPQLERDKDGHPTNIVAVNEPGKPTPLDLRPLNVGDRIVLCSDGMLDNVELSEVKRIVRESQSPKEAVSRLQKAAFDKMRTAGGKPDNLSIVVIFIEQPLRPPQKTSG